MAANRVHPPRSGGTNEGSESRSYDSYNPTRGQARERPRSAGSILSMDGTELPGRRHWASMDERDIAGLGAIDLSKHDFDIPPASDTHGTSTSSHNSVSAKEG